MDGKSGTLIEEVVRMAIGAVDLESWLAEPDCPQCGSEDVVLKESYKDSLGRTVKVWYCNKCGHTWTEIVA